MKIFIVKSGSTSLYEDSGNEFITLVTTDEEKAYSFLSEQTSERNYLTIWENEKEISEYYRDWYRWTSNKGNVFSKWERNSGEINERLEKENQKGLENQ